jgi:hypothetical protein
MNMTVCLCTELKSYELHNALQVEVTHPDRNEILYISGKILALL